MFRQLIEWMNTHLQAQAAKQAIANLSDATLADIGVTRSNIAALTVPAAPVRRSPETASVVFPAPALRAA